MTGRNSQRQIEKKLAGEFLDHGQIKTCAPSLRLHKKELNGLAVGMETVDKMLRRPENVQKLQESFQILFEENPIKAAFVAATLAEKLQRSGILARYFDVAEETSEKGDKTYTFIFADKAQVNNASNSVELHAKAGSAFPATE